MYDKSLQIKAAIAHPRILGVIHECGGKMYLREGDYKQAETTFFEAFKRYDESGFPRRIQCLQYLLLSNMLSSTQVNTTSSNSSNSNSSNNNTSKVEQDDASKRNTVEINLFDANEIKPYLNHPQILAMKLLLDAHQHARVREFEKILKTHEQELTSDAFLRDFIAALLKSIRVKTIVKLLKPYSRISLQFIAKRVEYFKLGCG